VIDCIKNVSKKILGNSVKISVVSFEPKEIVPLVQKVSRAKLLVGLTEGSLSSALFLPKDSAVVEIFPHGLSQENTPFIRVS